MFGNVYCCKGICYTVHLTPVPGFSVQALEGGQNFSAQTFDGSPEAPRKYPMRQIPFHTIPVLSSMYLL